MKLALYAHYSASDNAERYVLFYLQKLRELGFQIYFISNSPLSTSSEEQLNKTCDRVIQRENTGLDFAMWRHGLEECKLNEFDELLLTNSSIIGPLQPLAPLWERPEIAGCDFWGLTDNDEIAPHLQSYFLVFRRSALNHPRFMDFWRSVLPYRDKQQVIRCYEIGLTRWLEECGLKGKAIFTQGDIHSLFRGKRCKIKKITDRLYKRDLPGRNTMTLFPDLLIQGGMPFLKAALLRKAPMQVDPQVAFQLLESSALPREILEELRLKNVPAVS
jgi:lipopolysaccharide biosynthesis protein